tara:strand:- start:841 stop:948 length:108 start_codon:yes stop_codon:yes gene_type:complete
MKLTQEQLKKIIREELKNVISQTARKRPVSTKKKK